jgi:butyryl-CoA dehydrogenase
VPNILNRRDLDFLLYELLDAEALTLHPRYAEHGRETFDMILETAERLAEDVFQPFAAKLDANEPTFDGERVHIIPEVAEAIRAYCDAGFPTAGFDAEIGGMQLPYVVTQAVAAIFSAANGGAGGYQFLTAAAANLLNAHGSEKQKAAYLAPMVEGRWFGTMCLSEPQAGSSLADIRTRAEPQADGSYRLFGQKMWISGGEHDMAENIIHFVLAKIPGGPPGVKGISLFLVPRRLLDENDAPGERNDVRLMGLNHKMGNRGTVNTALAFGERNGAVGWLVGEKHQGLAAMFHMMNEARIGVGLSAVATGYTGYLHALDYAKTRPQGRPVENRDPAAPMIPIIEHADVKRMLMQQKAYVEGGLALCLYAASLVDRQKTGDDGAGLLLDLLTPIVKSWPSEYCLRANEVAIQVHGGYGYTRDFPVERLYRDNRLNHIHEGTRGIQGMDLLGRKVTAEGGAGLHALAAEIGATIDAAAAIEGLAEDAVMLRRMLDRALGTTLSLTSRAAQEGAAAYLANATIYLDMLGHVVVGWLWLRQAMGAAGKQAEGAARDFLDGKRTACRYFMRYELPQVQVWCDLLERMDRTCLDAPAAQF